MLICPACRTSFGENAPASGHCPQCGQPLAPSAGQETAATLEFVAAPVVVPAGQETAATLEFVAAPVVVPAGQETAATLEFMPVRAQPPGPKDKTVGGGY